MQADVSQEAEMGDEKKHIKPFFIGVCMGVKHIKPFFIGVCMGM